jgi:hypothetical protein
MPRRRVRGPKIEDVLLDVADNLLGQMVHNFAVAMDLLPVPPAIAPRVPVKRVVSKKLGTTKAVAVVKRAEELPVIDAEWEEIEGE